jgi:hypothetical protein
MKKMRSALAAVLTLLAALGMAAGCKTAAKKQKQDDPQSYGKLHAATGNGLDATVKDPMLWQKTELPRCLSNRVATKYFVWAEQKTLECSASGSWE